MFGLSSIPSSTTRWRRSSANTSRSVALGDLVAALDRVVAVHQDLGLDDRDDAGLLAQRGVARERVRVGVRCSSRVGMPSPIVITARHFAKRAPSAVVLLQGARADRRAPR